MPTSPWVAGQVLCNRLGDCPTFCVEVEAVCVLVRIVPLVGESVSEVNLQRGEAGRPGANRAPLGFGAFDREVDELGGGLFVGEVSAGLDRLADLAVHGLDRVGGVHDAAQV